MKTGLLLTNLGTPEAPTSKAVRKYLAEFLADPRVVEIPRWLWWPILRGIVLPLRSPKSAHAYQKIWTNEGSPLLVITTKQAQGLEQILQQQFNHPIKVIVAMRYGKPSIAEGLEFFRQEKFDKLIVLPLYPQYSSAATGSTFAAVAENLQTWRAVPELIFINNYADNTDYINALVNSIRAYWDKHPRGEKLMFSFHGLPKKSIADGDPYYFQCQLTAQLVANQLQLPQEQWLVVFQSRFGKQEWLQPYCDITLQELAKQGCSTIDVICPGFAADCLETLEEISIRNHETFIAAGGKQLNYIPALNDSAEHLTALAKIVVKYIND